jgi:formate hydrogenlyase subunit 3/multisubunit Na+/H+ antiporter MnhD subunit
MVAQPPNFSVEAGAALLVAGAFIKALPPLAAVFAITWYAIQIWQSETGRGWRMRWKRLFRGQLTVDDCAAFILLCLGGLGAAVTLYALGMVMS